MWSALACLLVALPLPQSASPSGSPASTLLQRPAGLRGEPCGNSMRLEWIDRSTGELGFVVLRRAGSAGPFQPIALTAPDATGYLDTAPNGTFQYAVAARGVVAGRPFDTRPTARVQASFPNSPPVLTTDLADRPFDTGSTARFHVTVSDPDGDPVSLRLLNPQPGMLFVPFRDRPSPATVEVRWERSSLGQNTARLVFEAGCTRLERDVDCDEGIASTFTGDVTGDGRLDLVVAVPRAGASDSGAVLVFGGAEQPTGDPTARLTVAGELLAPRNVYSPNHLQLADLDGDGLLDIVVQAASQKVFVWAGGPGISGTPAPTATLAPPGTSATPAAFGDNVSPLLQFADFDQNGIEDLVTIDRFADAAAVDSGAAFLWFGRPSLAGTLAPDRVLSVPGAVSNDWMGRGQNWMAERSLSLADVSGDGVLDFLVLAPLAQVGAVADAGAIYLFDGAAVLSGATAPAATLTTPLCAFCTGEPMLGDMTGDGLVDLVAGSPRMGDAGVPNEGFYQLWAGGNWSGTKPATATFRTGEATALGVDGVYLCDLDGDAALDFVAGTSPATISGFEDGVIYVWRGGALVGTPAPDARLVVPDGSPGMERVELQAVRDVDGDDRADVIAAGRADTFLTPAERALVWKGDALAGLLAPHATFGSSSQPVGALGLYFEDLDGDGVEDFLGKGTAGFALWKGPLVLAGAPPPTATLSGSTDHFFERVCDANGDGIEDLFLLGHGGTQSELGLWLGGSSMSGAVARQASYALSGSLGALEPADLNADGILDLLGVVSGATVNSIEGAGRIDVWLGEASPAGTLPVAATLRATSAFFRDYLAFDGLRLADLDGDGRADVLALSPYRNASASLTDTGAIQCFSGVHLASGTHTPLAVFADPSGSSGDLLGRVGW